MLISFLVCLAVFSVSFLGKFKLNNLLDDLAEEYLLVESGINETGSSFANTLLSKKGISDIYIGFASYPQIGSANTYAKYIKLHPAIYDSTSIIALAVSAHEAGHITQKKIAAFDLAFVIITQLIFFQSYVFNGIQLMIKDSPLFGISILVYACLFLVYASFKFTTLICECDATRKALADLRIYISEKRTYTLAKKWLFLALMKYSNDLLAALCPIAFIFLSF